MALTRAEAGQSDIQDIEGDSIYELIEAHLASDKLQLPVFNHIATKVRNLAESDDVDVSKLAKLIIQDQALAVQVLKYANSSFFGGLSPVKTVKEATVRLGLNQLVEIVVLITSKENYQTKNAMLEKHMKKLWKHSIACAFGCRWLAKKLGYRDLLQHAFMSGLFHDIGKLFVLKIIDDIDSADDCQIDLTESQVLDAVHTLHCEKGVMLLEEWRLPEEYRDIVRDHHNDDYNKANTTLSIVRLVDRTCNNIGAGLGEAVDRDSLDTELQITSIDWPEAQLLEVPEIMLAELELTIDTAVGLA